MPLSNSFTRAIVASVAAALSLASASPAIAQATHYTLSGNDIAIWNLSGTIAVVAGSGSDVTADVTMAGDNGSKLSVQTGEARGHQSLRVIFPNEDIRSPDESEGSGRTEVRVASDGTFGDDHGFFSMHKVRIGSSGLDARANVTVHLPAGKHLWIYLAAGKATVNGVSTRLDADLWSAALDVTNLTGDLGVDGGSGNVSISGLNGDASLDLGSGDARISNVQGTLLNVDGGSGGVSGDHITVGQLKLDMGSGDTRLSAVKVDDLDVDSGSGATDVSLSADARNVVIDSGSGDVTLRIPSNFGAKLVVDSGSGGFQADMPVTITSRHGSEMEGSIGDGNGSLRIDGGSGEVRLLRS